VKQSGAADVRIFIDNLYKFKVFRSKKLIREYHKNKKGDVF